MASQFAGWGANVRPTDTPTTRFDAPDCRRTSDRSGATTRIRFPRLLHTRVAGGLFPAKCMKKARLPQRETGFFPLARRNGALRARDTD